MLSASARCARSSLAEVNRAWSEIPLRCPLLLVSTVVRRRWYQQDYRVMLRLSCASYWLATSILCPGGTIASPNSLDTKETVYD